MLSVCNFDDYKLDVEFVYPATHNYEMYNDDHFIVADYYDSPYYFTGSF